MDAELEDAEVEAKLGASEAALESFREPEQPCLDGLALQSRSISDGNAWGQSDDGADDARGGGGGRTKPSASQFVVDARYSRYARTAKIRPAHRS